MKSKTTLLQPLLALSFSIITYKLYSTFILNLEDFAADTHIEYRKFAEPQGKFAKLSAGSVHYFLEGPENGELVTKIYVETLLTRQKVVLEHGISTNCYVFNDISAHLNKLGYRTLMFDLYGRGHSDAIEHLDYDHFLYLNQTEQLLAALVEEGRISNAQAAKFHLIGFSLGGAIATVFAAVHPDRIASLSLIAPAGAPFNVPFTAKLTLLPGIQYIMENSAIGNKILYNRVPDSFFAPEQFTKEIRELTMITHFHIKKKGFSNALASTLRHFPGLLYSDCLSYYELVGKAQFPVLIIWGENDRTVPIQCSSFILQRVPRAEFFKLEDAGHMVLWEKSQPVTQKLTTFLNSNKIHSM